MSLGQDLKRLIKAYLPPLLPLTGFVFSYANDATPTVTPERFDADPAGVALRRANARVEIRQARKGLTSVTRNSGRLTARPEIPGLLQFVAFQTLGDIDADANMRKDRAQGGRKPAKRVYGATALAAMLNVKDFGAKGDGVSDDYNALHAAAAAACLHPGAILTFPAGTYRIDRYRVTGGPNQNNVRNIQYINCIGTTIRGYNAKIDVKGDFRRTADYVADGYIYSYVDSVVPFEIIDSSGFSITGFEIAGNVDRMSRDTGVVEGNNAAIFTTHCVNYLIKDVFAHHFSADGVTLGGNSELADQRFRIDNITLTNNARDGLSIIQARYGRITNSRFDNNGRTGSYGSHAPAAGIDIEPERRPPHEDVYTGLITIDNCQFGENIGSQFVSGFPELVDSVTIQNSRVLATSATTSGQAFLNVPATGLVFHNTFQIGVGRSVVLSVDIPAQYGSIVHLNYDHNTFQLSENRGITGPIRGAPIDFTNNTVRVACERSDGTLMRLDHMQSVAGNSFFESATGFSGSLPTILYEFGNETIKNNTYDTDFAGSGFFEVYYGFGIAPSGEHFPHPQSFKPYYKTAPSNLKRPL